MLRLLVVCAANICRSPYGAAVLRSHYRPEYVDVASAGVTAIPGRGADSVMVDFARSRGWGDLEVHRSQPALARVLNQADLVLVMERGHGDAILRQAPTLTGRVRLFADEPPRDIADPFGREPQHYAAVIDLIETSAFEWVERLQVMGFVPAEARNVGGGRHG